MYVPEESHSGIVPMNHSNKDGTSLAESEEGRGAVDNAANLARCESLRRQLPVRTASISGACGGNEARSART